MNKISTIIAFMSVVLVSCSKSELDTMYSNQAGKIDSFVNNQTSANPGYRVAYNKGVVRLVTFEGEGEPLSSTGKVAFVYAGYDFTNGNISNSTLFVTNDRSMAENAKLVLSDDSVFETAEADLAGNDLIEGLRLGLQGVKAGEDCYILFTGKYGFGKKGFGTIPANASLAYYVHIVSIQND